MITKSVCCFFVVLSFLLGLFSGISERINITQIIKKECSKPEQFSTGGICLPENNFVAVVRQADGSKEVVWGSENITKLWKSPSPEK